MNAAQLAFLCGLAVVLAAVAVFATVVVRNAVGGTSGAVLGLLHRRGAEHSRLGRAAFFAHRVTGFAILAFLGLHILDVGLYSVSHRLYDDVQPLYGSAPLRLFECGLLFAVLFHTGNGLRLVAVDVARLSTVWTRRLLQLVFVLSITAGFGGSAVILAPLFR